MLKDKKHFIVIDDSKLDCFIAEKVIRNTGKCLLVTSFTGAPEALEYIKKLDGSDQGTIILVDIQMPVMNGFEFVEAFERLPAQKILNYIIYILSSTINENDLNKVHRYKSVKQFLNKPLTSNTLSALLSHA
jgi:CheY-like chemotaxis protein